MLGSGNGGGYMQVLGTKFGFLICPKKVEGSRGQTLSISVEKKEYIEQTMMNVLFSLGLA